MQMFWWLLQLDWVFSYLGLYCVYSLYSSPPQSGCHTTTEHKLSLAMCVCVLWLDTVVTHQQSVTFTSLDLPGR